MPLDTPTTSGRPGSGAPETRAGLCAPRGNASNAGNIGDPPRVSDRCRRRAPRGNAGNTAGSGGDLPGPLAAALARPDLAPRARAFLADLRRRVAAGRALTPRQLAAAGRIAVAPAAPDYAAVNRAALARLPAVLARLLPGGRAVGAEWRVGDLRGGPGDSLRVRLRGARAGAWADFAAGDKGGDPVSLAAAVARVPQAEAARRLARMLGLVGDGG